MVREQRYSTYRRGQQSSRRRTRCRSVLEWPGRATARGMLGMGVSSAGSCRPTRTRARAISTSAPSRALVRGEMPVLRVKAGLGDVPSWRGDDKRCARSAASISERWLVTDVLDLSQPLGSDCRLLPGGVLLFTAAAWWSPWFNSRCSCGLAFARGGALGLSL